MNQVAVQFINLCTLSSLSLSIAGDDAVRGPRSRPEMGLTRGPRSRIEIKMWRCPTRGTVPQLKLKLATYKVLNEQGRVGGSQSRPYARVRRGAHGRGGQKVKADGGSLETQKRSSTIPTCSINCSYVSLRHKVKLPNSVRKTGSLHSRATPLPHPRPFL